MKYIILTIIGLIVTWFVLYEPRKDVLFSASDELHTIILYEGNNEFLARFHAADIDGWKGNYDFRNDTIFLTYFDSEVINGKKANDVFIRKLAVDFETGKVRNGDEIGGWGFCAYGSSGDITRQLIISHLKKSKKNLKRNRKMAG